MKQENHSEFEVSWGYILSSKGRWEYCSIMDRRICFPDYFLKAEEIIGDLFHGGVALPKIKRNNFTISQLPHSIFHNM